MSFASGAEPRPTKPRTRRTITNASVRTTMTSACQTPSSLLTALTLIWHPHAMAWLWPGLRDRRVALPMAGYAALWG